MTTLDRYLARQITGGVIIAAIILLPLFGFIDLVEQLDDVGEGFYQVKDAFYFTLLMTPRRLIQLMPFIALFGNVIALGRLAVHSEIICMRATGLSPLRISKTPLQIAIYILVLMVVAEQYAAPVLEQKAHGHRSEALSQSTQLGENLGIWARDANHILRIGDRLHAASLLDVEIFNLDERGFLHDYI
ncbi:MAG: LptF/LptG family permease, partial [Gammaproteobacteria bacterium]